MALKFLNKKGWHTGSLRNIENVWKAEQKHEAEQKKLEELKKQIQDEREQSEFRQLQEQAGLVPKQERLEFLYDSGLAVGKGSSDSFALGKPGEPQKIDTENELSKLAAVPGALFTVEKPASANDTWRKLHSDPLLMIRQREQEALSQIRNNPVKMEMIKKSLDVKKLRKEEKEKKKAEKKKRKKEKHKRESSSDSESDIDTTNRLRKTEKKKRKKEMQKRETGSDSDSDSDMDATTRLKKVQVPKDIVCLKNSEKQQERRCQQEKPRPPSNYRQHRAQSPLENRERRRSRSPNHGKILSHRSRYRSRSPPEYGERHRSRSPLDHVKSQHYAQKHESRSPSDYGRRHRSPLQNDGRHRSPSGYVRRQKSPLQDSGRHRSPSESGRRHNSPLQDSVRHRPPLQDSARYRAHSPDGLRTKLPLEHRNKIVPQQDRVTDLHARGADSQSAEKKPSNLPDHTKPGSRPKYQAGKLSEEEKAARLREMQMDAELHDEQRWHRLKKASEADAREAVKEARGSGKNFLDVTNKSVYGAEKGGSSTIEESVRRRTHYLQGSANATEGNAFRR